MSAKLDYLENSTEVEEELIEYFCSRTTIFQQKVRNEFLKNKDLEKIIVTQNNTNYTGLAELTKLYINSIS